MPQGTGTVKSEDGNNPGLITPDGGGSDLPYKVSFDNKELTKLVFTGKGSFPKAGDKVEYDLVKGPDGRAWAVHMRYVRR